MRADYRTGDAAALVAAGGAGLRLGPGAPKALRRLAGEPLLVHAVRALAAAECVGCLVIAAPAGAESRVRGLLRSSLPDVADERLLVVTGGGQRQESVAAALRAVPPGFPAILVHDAARALTPTSLVRQVAAAVRAGHEAVIPVLPVVDTVVETDPAGLVTGHPDRGALRAVQTPQGFDRGTLERAHAVADAASATDDASLVGRLGVPVHTVPGSPRGLKITTPYDLVVAEAMLADDTLVH